MFNMGPSEIMVILLIALMVFGPKKLPEIGRTVGKSLQQFRKAQSDIKAELRSHLNPDDETSGAPSTTAEQPDPDQQSLFTQPDQSATSVTGTATSNGSPISNGQPHTD